MKKNKINDGHFVEALDRLFFVTDIMDRYLMSHPVIKKDKEIKKLIKFSIINLLEAYQRVGNNTYEKEFERPSISEVVSGRREKSEDNRLDRRQKLR
jgi:hypothetical protein